MKVFMTGLMNYLASEDGPSAVEYVVTLGTVILVFLGAMTPK